MKKTVLISLCLVATISAAPTAQAKPPGECVTIQSGELYSSAGDLLETGYDVWGYNYQAHIFNGTYCDAYRDASWCQAYRDVELTMKWNDAWLSNQDCDDDRALDRHHGHDSYIGSGAWTTNHQSGVYVGDDGKSCRWTWFVKIVAVPSDSVLVGGIWFDSYGDQIGPQIWGSFATIQSIYNDPCGGHHGVELKGARPGLGSWED